MNVIRTLAMTTLTVACMTFTCFASEEVTEDELQEWIKSVN